MTLEEIAAIKTLSADEHSALWDAYYGLAPEGDHVSPENRAALEELIRTAPSHITRLMPHCNVTEFVGYFPWRRHNGTVGLVSVSVCPDNDACMCDAESSDLAYFFSTVVA
ncbi:hypothetical protein GFL39_26425 [Rhizobium leguminosarum bv. viciae]|uniref:hypothetical protein n=1 Tax=Rhizobium leguminosarum TaxID=384 RepID=UPI0014421195|nr:hypothetical protein [Rhizobium leguminosarum]NKL08409.1 hypothetical protein [Rhizobium leguminosarum bv. viciae]